MYIQFTHYNLFSAAWMLFLVTEYFLFNELAINTLFLSPYSILVLHLKI